MKKVPARKIGLRTISSLNDIGRDQWDKFANHTDKPFDPFISHDFLSALELSGSAVPETGWYGQHIIIQDEKSGETVGIMPCYLKAHSSGEYVFDYGWADAYERAGGQYYPKLQSSVPFTPVTGERFLTGPAGHSPLAKDWLGMAAQELCRKYEASSFHVTFLPRRDWQRLASDGWLQRTDIQFHWHNNGYSDFSDYLASMSSRKRKNVRREREIALSSGLSIELLSGSDLEEYHWDAFYEFYVDTGGRKWGTPYLDRSFFSMISQSMGEHILLIMAKRAGRYIAGALNFIGGDALYGRNWGAIEHHDCLHFELCYYQAIEYAIAHKLKRVEAGAQGEHKLARGYLPVTTHSLHYLADPRLASAVRNYLSHERAAIEHNSEQLHRHSPFRDET